VAYTEIRRRCFFAALPPEAPLPAPEGASIVGQAFHAFLRWFRQPHLPADPINNPLIEADFPHGWLALCASTLAASGRSSCRGR
jgi:hypothetical protein